MLKFIIWLVLHNFCAAYSINDPVQVGHYVCKDSGFGAVRMSETGDPKLEHHLDMVIGHDGGQRTTGISITSVGISTFRADMIAIDLLMRILLRALRSMKVK